MNRKKKLSRKQKRDIYRKVRQDIERLLTYSVNKRRARFSKKDHTKFFIYASLLNAFAEGISQSLDEVTSADTLLYYIKSQNREKMQEIFESELKRSIQRLKRQSKLWKAVSIAIDWHDEMYYGKHEKTSIVNGTKSKKGSSYAFQFLTGISSR